MTDARHFRIVPEQSIHERAVLGSTERCGWYTCRFIDDHEFRSLQAHVERRVRFRPRRSRLIQLYTDARAGLRGVPLAALVPVYQDGTGLERALTVLRPSPGTRSMTSRSSRLPASSA